KPTLVLPIEFYDGYTRQEITQFRRSEFTKANYIHYAHYFPREDEAFLQSGNYLLKVFRNGDESDLVLTRRFVVSDRKAVVANNYMLDPNMERSLLNQLRFDVSVGNTQMLSPNQDLIIQVMQNFRWDNAFQVLRPRFIRENRLEYMVNLPQAFAGGGEFRHLDMRSTRLYGRTTRKVEEQESAWLFYSRPDELKRSNFLIQYPDLNGNYFVAVNEWEAPAYQADYVTNHFQLDVDFPFDSSEVYLFGRFTDWRLQERYRMRFNETKDRYEASVNLKQGMYDYIYVVDDQRKRALDETTLEGDPGEDENFYTVLVYFRAPADRRHQLIGLQALNYR
ncbi:MAG: type IX secretion system plug protein domain-containing protein, partial [Bacteroidota bacterium]